jgi:competence protein ComEC
MALIYLSSAFLAGIYLGARLSPSFAVIWPWFILAFLLLVISRHKRLLLWAGLCLAVFAVGLLRFEASVPSFDQDKLIYYNGQKVELVGVVVSDPEPAGQGVKLQVSARKIKLDGSSETRPVSGKALVRLPSYPEYRYGDMLRLTGELETPPSQGQNFDSDEYYRDYLARQGIYASMYYPKAEFIEVGHGSAVMGWLASVRNRLSRSLASALPEPQASLAQSLLLGQRTRLPSDLYADFSRSGTAHILAISGSNISIVAGILLSLGIWLFGRRRSIYILLALLGVWLYVMLSGMQAPAVRAAIMASLFLVALHLGRQRSVATALAFAAAVMVGVQPSVLWDVSFQLSFMAMAGLVFLWPPLQDLSRGLVAKYFREGRLASLGNLIGDSFTVGLAAVLATWPLIAYTFGYVSLMSLPATLLALLALPFIIVIAAISGVLGLFVSPLAMAVGWLAWFFLSYMIKVVEGFAALPLASVDVRMPGGWVWGYYLALAVILWLGSKRGWWRWLKEHLKSVPVRPALAASRTWLLVPLVALAVVVWMAAAWPAHSSRLQVSFLDVGQGDAILIETPSQRQILIDGGPSCEQMVQELGQKLPFWDRSLDLVVLSHPHSDHLSGLIAVLQRYRVEQVLEPEIGTDSAVYQEWIRAVEERDVKRTTAQVGQRIDLGDGISLEVLNPQHPQSIPLKGEGIDDKAVVLRLSWNKVSFLLTSDVGEGVERELLAQGLEVDSAVLKVGHHGSATSTSEEFLAAVSPKVAVISVGAENDYGLPSAEVVTRLKQCLGEDKVLLTSERGTIEINTDGQRLWVKTER